jgi:sterol desaturase/sphingolipid hydroxylase (fatty acid hydroxylase superfamily)
MSDIAETALSDGSAPYAPPYPIPVAPLFAWPPKPAALLQYFFSFPGYLWPYYASFTMLAVLAYEFLPPTPAEAAVLAPGWIAAIAGKDAATLLVISGGLYYFLYIKRTQGLRYKYHQQWPATRDPRFLFKSQVLDNVFWNFCGAVPIATAYEAGARWLYASGRITPIEISDHPVYFAALVMATPIWAYIHFWAVHRILHWAPLYKWAHHVHHKNVNVNPWSGLAMHPIEHLVFFSGCLVFFIVPAHPLLVMIYLNLLLMMTPIDHNGFHRILLPGGKAFDVDFYMHYLHHKFFRVNYAFDTSFPADVWQGTFHDGTQAGQEAMKRRMKA